MCACELTGTKCARKKMLTTLSSQLTGAEPAKTASAKPRRWRHRLAWVSAFGCGLLVVCYVFRASLLTLLAEAWEVNEPAARADAIVVLGGGLENRPFAAAKLYHAGVAPVVLYMDVRLSPSEELGISLPEKEQTRRILLSNGVPESAMTLIGNEVGSTFDESQAARAWLQKSGAKSVVIPTDIFHARRVRWIFRKELRDTKTEIHVVGVKPLRYSDKDWWQHEEGLIAFQNEIIKSLYYRFKY